VILLLEIQNIFGISLIDLSL